MLTVLIPLAFALPQADSPDWIDHFLEGSRALEQGEHETAESALKRALELRPRHAPIAWQLAGACARGGEEESALAWLERAVEWGGGDAALLDWDPDLASLRGSSRFDALGERLLERPQPRDFEPLEAGLARGGGYVNSASEHAEFLVSGRGPQTFLWDLRVGEVVATLERPGEEVAHVAISPDGRWVVASGSSSDKPRTHFLRVHDGVTGDFVTELEGMGWQARVQFDRAGTRMLAARSTGKGCAVWETKDWTKISEPPFAGAQARLSPDGQRVLLLLRKGNSECDLLLWDADTNKLIARHAGLATRPNTGWDFSSDGSLILVVENQSGVVAVFDGLNGEQVQRIEPATDRFTSACFLGATERLATIDKNRQVCIWQARDGKELRSLSLTSDDDSWRQLEASPDGSRLLVRGLYGDLEVIDVEKGEPLWSVGITSDARIHSAAHIPDGSRVLVRHSGGTCAIHDAESGELLSTHGDLELDSLVRAHPTRDELWMGREDGSLLRIDAVHGRTLGRWQHHGSRILDLCLTRDGDLLAALDHEGVLRVIATATGAVVATIPGANPSGDGWRTPHMEFAPDSSALLVADSGTALRIYAGADWSQRCAIEVEAGRPVWSWSHDGRWLAAAADDGRVWIFDAITGLPTPTEIEIDAEYHVLAFEPGGERLWVGDSASGVHVFERKDGTRVRRLDLEDLDGLVSVNVGSITFRQDGKVAVTASSGFGVVAAWDVETGKRLWDYSYNGGNGSSLHSAFNGRGDHVYVWGQTPHTTRVVDTENGKTLVDLAGNVLGDLLVLPDDERIAAYGPEGVEAVHTSSGDRLWARIDMAGTDWLLTAPTRHVDGTRTALKRLHLVLPGRSSSLDALAAAVLDPKKVRAASEGVELAPARLPAVPELTWETRQPRVVHLKPDRTTHRVTLEASCPAGLDGFEILQDGKRRVVFGEVISSTERRLSLELDGPMGAEAVDYRCRAISSSGILSRSLHLTLESGQ